LIAEQLARHCPPLNDSAGNLPFATITGYLITVS
jgi:hypothetical protein